MNHEALKELDSSILLDKDNVPFECSGRAACEILEARKEIHSLKRELAALLWRHVSGFERIAPHHVSSIREKLDYPTDEQLDFVIETGRLWDGH
jgi:hypothetical protein